MSVISAILHRFQSAIADAGEAGLLGPTEWNDTHDVTVDVPAASAFGDAQAEGVATSLSRSDHVHAREADPVTAHVAAGDPHTGYRLESADHSHATTGLQGGQLAQANTHGTPDTDAAAGSLHHTIGAGATQASAGNHSHTAQAPVAAKYLVRELDAGLSAEVAKPALYDNFDPDDYPTAPNSLDDEFEGAGAIDAKWTKVNDPAAGDALSQALFPGYLFVGLSELGTDDFANLVQLYQAAPSGAAIATYTAKVAIVIDSGTNALTDAAEFSGVGIALIDSVNSLAIGAGVQLNDAVPGSDNIPLIGLGFNENFTAFGTSIPFLSWAPGEFIYLRLRKTTTAAYTSSNTYEMDVSANGIIWQNIASGAKTFTGLCDRVGLLFRRPKSATGTPHVQVIIDSFRRVA